MTLKTLATQNNESFVYDDTTLTESSEIMTCDFIMLKCIKMISPNLDSNGKVSFVYQYPQIVFRNLNMCHISQIVSNQPASETESIIFNLVATHRPLGKALNKYLRNNYMIEMSYSENDE